MRKGELFANLLMVLGIPVMIAGVIASKIARTAPTATAYGMVLCAVVGVGLFVTAKISVLRKGQLLTYGMESMDHRHRVFYVCGYALMITALVLMLGLGFIRL